MSKRPTTAGSFLSRLRRPAGRLRDMPIWSKLGLIMIVPTIATVVVGTSGLVDHLQTLNNANRAGDLANLVGYSGDLVNTLQDERTNAVLLLGSPKGQARAQYQEAYNRVNQRVDQSKTPYSQQRGEIEGLPANLETQLDRIDGDLSEMPGIRSQVYNGKLRLSEAVSRYTGLINNLITIRDSATQLAGDNDLSDQMRAAAAMARAKEYASVRRIAVHQVLLQKAYTPALRELYISSNTGEQQALQSFQAVASRAEREFQDQTISGSDRRQADIYAGQVSALNSDKLDGLTFSTDQWDAAMVAYAQLNRAVEVRLDSDVVAKADELRSDVQRQVFLETGLLLSMLLLAILFAYLVARSMARSLRELRQGALSIAQFGLPQAVARLRDPQFTGQQSPAQLANQIAEPLPVRSRDEFGQVTEAFNAVHLEAVRTAAEQAALRSSVATMFVNLARRSQILVDRLIGHLDRLERGEEDPDRLAELFQLDHLATRMRRNDENLLVLAGADSTRVQREPAALIDVLRAAQSEVEHYTRIEFGVIDRDIEVSAHAVNDLVHLVAELFDNATAFSPPDSQVMVEARRVGDRASLYVEDRGIGISAEQLSDLNDRLATPPQVDVAVSRMMGLVVVARLASRHGVKVELRPGTDRGTVAEVVLPTSVLVPRALTGRAPGTPGLPGPGPQFGGAAPAFGGGTPSFGGAAPAFGGPSSAFGGPSPAPAFGGSGGPPTFGALPALGNGRPPAPRQRAPATRSPSAADPSIRPSRATAPLARQRRTRAARLVGPHRCQRNQRRRQLQPASGTNGQPHRSTAPAAEHRRPGQHRPAADHPAPATEQPRGPALQLPTRPAGVGATAAALGPGRAGLRSARLGSAGLRLPGVQPAGLRLSGAGSALVGLPGPGQPATGYPAVGVPVRRSARAAGLRTPSGPLPGRPTRAGPHRVPAHRRPGRRWPTRDRDTATPPVARAARRRAGHDHRAAPGAALRADAAGPLGSTAPPPVRAAQPAADRPSTRAAGAPSSGTRTRRWNCRSSGSSSRRGSAPASRARRGSRAPASRSTNGAGPRSPPVARATARASQRTGTTGSAPMADTAAGRRRAARQRVDRRRRSPRSRRRPGEPPAPTRATAWRTAADDGWRAAARGRRGAGRGDHPAGLPKRAPMAQLVPGGVEKPTTPSSAVRRRRYAVCSPRTTEGCSAAAPADNSPPGADSGRASSPAQAWQGARRHDNYAGSRLAARQLRRPRAGGRACGRGLRGRPAPGLVAGPSARPGRPAGRDRVRSGQPDPGRGPLLRGRRGAADGRRDGQRVPVPDVHLGRFVVRGAGRPQLRRRPGRLRDGAAGRPGRRRR